MKHIQSGCALQGAICPNKIETKGLFALDVDNIIWQDVGLNNDNWENPSLLAM